MMRDYVSLVVSFYCFEFTGMVFVSFECHAKVCDGVGYCCGSPASHDSNRTDCFPCIQSFRICDDDWDITISRTNDEYDNHFAP